MPPFSPPPVGAQERLLYIFARDAASPELRSQRAVGDPAADNARDLRRVEVVGDGAEARILRRRFGVAGAFGVVLVGRDGGIKLTAARPVSAATLAATIDAMPMRRDEMRRAK